MKEEALDRTVWRDGFGRGFGLAVRQTAEWLKDYIYIYRNIIHKIKRQMLVFIHLSTTHNKLFAKALYCH